MYERMVSFPVALEGALDTLEALMDSPKHPRRRAPYEPRENIEPYVRLAVFRRDGFRCKACGRYLLPEGNYHVDHVIPWSAGGTNASSNLRVLCPSCNLSRGTRRDLTEDRCRLPVTWWCLRCWVPGVKLSWWAAKYADLFGPPGWSGWYFGHPLCNPDDPQYLAYCSTCRAEGYTAYLL